MTVTQSGDGGPCGHRETRAGREVKRSRQVQLRAAGWRRSPEDTISSSVFLMNHANMFLCCTDCKGKSVVFLFCGNIKQKPHMGNTLDLH